MDNLKTLSTAVINPLLELSKDYIQGDFKSLSKVPFSYRDDFSACVEYLRSKCGKHYSEYSKEIEDDNWPIEIKESLLEKIKDMDTEHYRRKHKDRLSEMNWRIDVALSTNSLSRVLKPEVHFKLLHGDEKTEFHMTVAQFLELRRQTASIIKDVLTMDQFAFIKNLN
jgi:COMM domain